MINRLCIWLLAALCAGCASAVHTRYYTLEPTQIPSSQSSSRFALGVGPLTLAEHLEHPAVIALGAGNELLVASDHLWAGDLKRSLSRVLALDIGARLGSVSVFSYPWDRSLRPQHQLVLTVENLSGTLGGEVELLARWQVVAGRGGEVLAVRQQRFVTTASGPGYNTYVAAINQLVGQWAAALTETVLEVWPEAGAVSTTALPSDP